MEIKKLVLGYIGENCYLVSSDNAAIVIDPGYESQEAEEFLKENSGKQRLILLTHSHFDHIGGAEKLRDNTDTKIAIGETEAPSLLDKSLTEMFGVDINPFSADIELKDNEIVTVGDLEIKVIFTPGHTKGGVCYYINGVLFSGDTLFHESIGRTDFPGGSFAILKESVKMLYADFDGKTPVLSGHGEETTIEHERNFNPYIR